MQLSVPWRRGQRRPFGSIPRINWSHPLAQDLVIYVYDTGSGVFDLVSGQVGKVGRNGSTSSGFKSYPFGSGISYDANIFTYFPEGGLSGTNVYNNFGGTLPFSFGCATYLTSAPTGNVVIAGLSANNNGGNNASALFFNDTASFFSIAWDNGATVSDWVQTWGSTFNIFQSWLAVPTSSTTALLYGNGKLDSSLTGISSTTGSLSQLGSPGGMAIGANTNSGAIQGTGGIPGFFPYAAGWNRSLSAAEALQLHQDPYCFLIYPEDEIFATLVGVSAAAAFTWSQTDYSQFVLPKGHLVREMIRHD